MDAQEFLNVSSLNRNQRRTNPSYAARIRSNLLNQSRQFESWVLFHFGRFYVLFLRTCCFHSFDYTNAPRSLLRRDYIRTLIAYTAFYVSMICLCTIVFVVQYLNGKETLLSTLIFTIAVDLLIGFFLVLALVFVVKTHPYKKIVEVEHDNLLMNDLNLDESIQAIPQNEFAYRPFRSQSINIPGASHVSRARSPSTVCTDLSSSNDCWVDDDIFHLSMTTGPSDDSGVVSPSDFASASKEADVHQVLHIDCNRRAETNGNFWNSGAKTSIHRETALARNKNSPSEEIFDILDCDADSFELTSLLHRENSSMQSVQCGTEEPVEEKPQFWGKDL